MNRTVELACQVVMGNVAEQMAARSMSAPELARATGVPQTTLRRWLAGGNMPVAALWWLARALAVDPATLVEGI